MISDRKSHISFGGELGTFTSLKKILGVYEDTFCKDTNTDIIHSKL